MHTFSYFQVEKIQLLYYHKKTSISLAIYFLIIYISDDAQYRLDWIEQIYTPEMHNDYVFPNVFMSNEDTDTISELETDLSTYMNTCKADWIMNGMADGAWEEYLGMLEEYRLSDYLAIMQKYLDAYYA